MKGSEHVWRAVVEVAPVAGSSEGGTRVVAYAPQRSGSEIAAALRSGVDDVLDARERRREEAVLRALERENRAAWVRFASGYTRDDNLSDDENADAAARYADRLLDACCERFPAPRPSSGDDEEVARARLAERTRLGPVNTDCECGHPYTAHPAGLRCERCDCGKYE